MYSEIAMTIIAVPFLELVDEYHGVTAYWAGKCGRNKDNRSGHCSGGNDSSPPPKEKEEEWDNNQQSDYPS